MLETNSGNDKLDRQNKRLRIIVFALAVLLIGLGVCAFIAINHYNAEASIQYELGYQDGKEAANAETQNDSSYTTNDTEEADHSNNASNDTVYVTDTGSCYHQAGCSYLRSSSHAISLEEAIDEGYEPCSRCCN